MDFQLFSFLIGLIVGGAIGFWAYRYFMKKDPNGLENFVDQTNDLGTDAKRQIKELIERTRTDKNGNPRF